MADKIIVGMLIIMFSIAIGWSIASLIREIKPLFKNYKKGGKVEWIKDKRQNTTYLIK